MKNRVILVLFCVLKGMSTLMHMQVDTMIVQAIGLLDDLDKELNTYAMRVREWYGWHFPEMTRIVTDNVTYARAVSHQYRPLIPLWTYDFWETMDPTHMTCLVKHLHQLNTPLNSYLGEDCNM